MSCWLQHYTVDMQKAICPISPALMLVLYQFTKLFADRFCAIGASNQTKLTTVGNKRRFLCFADWLMGLKITFPLGVQSRILMASGSWFWGEPHILTGTLTCFVLLSSTVLFSVKFFDLGFNLHFSNLFIKDVWEHKEWNSNSKWSLHCQQRNTTWP